MKTNKEIITIGKNRFFTVNYEKKVVYYTQKHHGDTVICSAVTSDEDVFNPEYGKALAYARADLNIREYEYLTLDITSSKIIYKTRFERKLHNIIQEEKKHQKHYLVNQRRLVKELLKNCSVYSKTTSGDWHTILKTAMKNSKKD